MPGCASVCQGVCYMREMFLISCLFGNDKQAVARGERHRKEAREGKREGEKEIKRELLLLQSSSCVINKFSMPVWPISAGKYANKIVNDVASTCYWQLTDLSGILTRTSIAQIPIIMPYIANSDTHSHTHTPTGLALAIEHKMRN